MLAFHLKLTSWSDFYNMPVRLRNWLLERTAQEYKKQNEMQEKEAKGLKGANEMQDTSTDGFKLF